MTEVRPAPDAECGRWLLEPDVDWWTLVRFGPPGFDAYVRVAFGVDEDLEQDPPDTMRIALAALASETTSTQGCTAIWEGWGSSAPLPRAPRLDVPHRLMLLFTGPLSALRDAPGLAWHGPGADDFQQPHLVWPEDRAWCVACEVDEEIEFTVGCSEHAAGTLASALPGATRSVAYGAALPMYRDEV